MSPTHALFLPVLHQLLQFAFVKGRNRPPMVIFQTDWMSTSNMGYMVFPCRKKWLAIQMDSEENFLLGARVRISTVVFVTIEQTRLPLFRVRVGYSLYTNVSLRHVRVSKATRSNKTGHYLI